MPSYIVVFPILDEYRVFPTAQDAQLVGTCQLSTFDTLCHELDAGGTAVVAPSVCTRGGELPISTASILPER